MYHYHRDHYPSRTIFHWIAWPDCCRPICYDFGLRFTFGHFWPYYHRKFVFVSLGGYWPSYRYRRYYWYGWHPYTWYGDYPPEHVIVGGTYNYYYYDNPPRYEALGDAHKELEEKPLAGPEETTQADHYFEEAVKAFEDGDYVTAAAGFHDAIEAAPDDIVLPFAYVQALFAGGEYEKAANVLRKTLIRVSPQEEGVFYPRGLYADGDVLQEQIDKLRRAVRLGPADADLQLLLGYQLLGTGKFDEAEKHLQNARLDSNNAQAATLLLDLLKKLTSAGKNAADGNKEQVDKPENLRLDNSEVESTGQAEDINANAPEKPNDEDTDLRGFAALAENWLAVK